MAVGLLGDPNAMIHVTMGQPSGPTWSIDIYQVALRTRRFPESPSTPALWIEGSFHADSDTPANFPNLQVSLRRSSRAGHQVLQHAADPWFRPLDSAIRGRVVA